MINWLLTFIFVISIFQIGLLVEYYVFKKGASWEAARCWALGLGSIAIFQLILGWGNILTGHIVTQGLSLIIYLPFVFDSKLRIEFKKQITGYLNHRPAYGEIVISIIFIAIMFVFTFSEAIWGHDAYTFWLSKGRAFFLDGGITRHNLYTYWPFDQPILWPLVVTWFYRLTGLTDGYFIRNVPFITYLLIGFQFKNIVWRAIVLLTPFLILTVIMPEYAGNADLLMAFFLLLTAGQLFQGSLRYGGIFLGLAALTKNEALPILLAYPVLLVLFLRREKEFWSGILFSGGFFLFNLGFKQSFGLNSRYLGQSLTEIFQTRPVVRFMTYTALAIRENFRQLYRWGIGWGMVIFLLAVYWQKIRQSPRMLVFVLLIGVYFLSLFWVYYVTPENQATQIATSLSRVLVQVFPALILLVSLLSPTATGTSKRPPR